MHTTRNSVLTVYCSSLNKVQYLVYQIFVKWDRGLLQKCTCMVLVCVMTECTGCKYSHTRADTRVSAPTNGSKTVVNLSL